jgi:hypothetical protein
MRSNSNHQSCSSNGTSFHKWDENSPWCQNELLEKGADIAPGTVIGEKSKLIHIYHQDSTVDLNHPELPGDDAWTNFFRSDDVAALAYFYLDKPVNSLPAIQDLSVRTWSLK